MLTAVAATRAILAVLGGFDWFDNPRFMGATGQGIPRWLRWDFMGRRRIWFAISGAVVALSILAIAVNGLNLGIDFRGGTQLTFRTPEPTSLEQVRKQAAAIGQAGAVIQGRGGSADGNYSSFQIRTESLTTAEQNELQQGLTDTVEATSFGAKNVSESFGRQIANNALFAIVVSLLLIVAYISVRFQWKYSVGVLVALAHDIVITIGIYALTGREMSTATVAAILTVLGYSIYDTIIVFDRMRENVPLMRRASFRVIGNVSMWEVLPRSLATTFITLLPVASLYFFGGDTLQDFAFALLVGIGSGAYSSIFLAAPLVAALKEREPEFARRRDDLGALAGVASVGGTLAAEAEEVAASDDESADDDEPAREDARPAPVPLVRRAGPLHPPSGSGVANAAPRGPMADPDSERPHPLETLSLAGVGRGRPHRAACRRAGGRDRRGGSAWSATRFVHAIADLARQLAPRGDGSSASRPERTRRARSSDLGAASRESVADLALRDRAARASREAPRAGPRTRSPPRSAAASYNQPHVDDPGSAAAEPRASVRDRTGRGTPRLRLLPPPESSRRPLPSDANGRRRDRLRPRTPPPRRCSTSSGRRSSSSGSSSRRVPTSSRRTSSPSFAASRTTHRRSRSSRFAT